MLCSSLIGHLYSKHVKSAEMNALDAKRVLEGVQDTGNCFSFSRCWLLLNLGSQPGVTHSRLQNWVPQAKIDQGNLLAGSRHITEELRNFAFRLRKNKRLKEEMGLVKLTASLFPGDDILQKQNTR